MMQAFEAVAWRPSSSSSSSSSGAIDPATQLTEVSEVKPMIARRRVDNLPQPSPRCDVMVTEVPGASLVMYMWPGIPVFEVVNTLQYTQRSVGLNLIHTFCMGPNCEAWPGVPVFEVVNTLQYTWIRP